MPTDDKKKIIRPDEPGANINAPRPNPARNVGDQLLGTTPGRPTPAIRAGAPAPNLTPDPLSEPRDRVADRYIESGSERHEASKKDQVRQKAREAKQSVQQMAKETRGQVTDLYRQVDSWVSDQVAQRPVGTVMGAFAAGYVISAGLPRVVVRTVARIGLPLAAAGYLARMLSEGRFDRMLEGKGRRGERETGQDVHVTP